MKKDVVKLGVVGLGRGGYVTETVIGEKKVQLRAICDINPEKLEAARKIFEDDLKVSELLCFTDFDEFLKSDIDAVYIATDAIYHVPFVEKAMEAGKHVLSEIPPVNSVEEAKRLRAIVKAHPELKYMAGENCCWWAFIESWKKMFDEGKLGDVVYAEAEYLHSEDFNKFVKPADGHWRTFNPAIKYLTHDLGPLLYIMNDRCVSVSCMVSDVSYNPYKTLSAQNGVALFKTAKGAIIRVLVCFGAYVGLDHNYEIIGTRGTVETDKTKPLSDAHYFARLSDIPGTIEEKIDVPVTLKYPGEISHPRDGHGGADKKMLMAFIDCIVNDTVPPIDVDLGIRMALPGIIADLSSQSGGTLMEIPDPEDF